MTEDIHYKIVENEDRTKIELRLTCKEPIEIDAFYGVLLELVDRFKDSQVELSNLSKSSFKQ